MVNAIDPHRIRRHLQDARFSTDPEVLHRLAHEDVPTEVLASIARNPATATRTLEYLIERDERWLTYPATRREDLPADIMDRIARRLSDRNAIYHATSAPSASPQTLRYLAAHPAAPAGAIEQVQRLLVSLKPLTA